MKFQLLILKYLYKHRFSFYPKDRKSFNTWQDKKVKKFLNKVVQKSNFYSQQLREFGDFNKLPLMNKKIMMENFDNLNTVGITKEEAFKVALESEESRDFSSMIGDITVGLSSGTSGNRGLFIVSPDERAQWVAYVLAKVLWPIKGKRKIAFFLRANNNLYSSVKSNILDFKYFDLKEKIETNLNELEKYNPDIIVSPPSMLRVIAKSIENKTINNIFPEKIISVAELLEESDKEYLKKIFNQTIYQAYQCTEGFLASSCQYGVLHFNEDIIKIEKEYISKEENKFYPIITDFTRFSQPIIKYKLNDIIIEKTDNCKCGSIFTAIERIEGRSDDVFYFKNSNNKEVCIFPDFFRRSVIMATEEIEEYIVEEREPNLLKIFLKVSNENNKDKISEKVENSLRKLLKDFEIEECEIDIVYYIPEVSDIKLRRIKRTFKLPENVENLILNT